MHQHGRGPAEILVQQQMLGSRREPLLAADHVRDLHQVVVDDVGEVIRRQAVGLQQHLHVDRRVLERDRSAREIVDDARPFRRHLHSHDVRFAGRRACRRLVGRDGETVAVVVLRHAGGALRGAHRLEPLRRAEASEGVPVRQQLVGVAAVDRGAFALAVRCVRAADVRAFVPAQARPAQRGEDRAPRTPASSAPDRCPRFAAGTDRRACARTRSSPRRRTPFRRADRPSVKARRASASPEVNAT